MRALIHGIGSTSNDTLAVPLHRVYIVSPVIEGSFIVGLISSLPVKAFINYSVVGNDFAVNNSRLDGIAP